MSKFRKNEIEFIKYWQYQGISRKDKYTPIVLDSNMQIPCCYLFRIYGEIHREICFLAKMGGIGKYFGYIDNNNILFAGFGNNIIKYDLNTNELIKIVVDREWIHNFFKLDDGYLLQQEMTVKYFDNNLNILWENSDCVEIFANTHLAENYEIGKNYIAIIDWCGYKHYYNKLGKFKEEKTKYDSYKSKI